MENQRKRRLSSRQAKRLRTLRANKSKEHISADARRAAKLSGGHFDTTTSLIANQKRWAAYRARKAAEQKENDK